MPEIPATKKEPNKPPTLHKSRSAERVLALLDAVVTAGSTNLTNVAAAVDVPPSTALRHLRLLADHGYLIKDGFGLYSVGPSFIRIALASFQSGPYARLTAAAQPSLDRLAAITEESAYLAVRDGTDAVYVATVESPRAVRHVGWVGRSVPVAGTAIGDALTSGGPKTPDSPNPQQTPVFFNTGAVEADVTAVVAPIYGPNGVVGALSVLGPKERLTKKRVAATADAVVAEADLVSESLV